MISLELENFSLAQIAASGQCFRMTDLKDGSFEIIADDRYLKAAQEGNIVNFGCGSLKELDFWIKYFDLEENYAAFGDAVDPEDGYLSEAYRRGSGIRILRQDLWEVTASFLISQNNNISRIRRCIANICERYGRKMQTEDGVIYHAFPEAEAFAGLEPDALMACNLGYRSKYLVRSAEMIASGKISLDRIKRMRYPDAKAELLKLYGVGGKVADCICLFALHHLEAFPTDTHIKQVLAREYPEGFPFARYGGYEGVIQQYIFYRELTDGKDGEINA